MAQDKKGFILYADLIHTLEKLPNDLAGELFKHILRYVNDQEPKTENFTVDLVFEQIKQQLKRDLKKYETRAERSRLNGLKGGRPKNPKEPRKPSGLKNNPDEPRKPDKEKGIGIGIDTDIGIVKEKDINKKVYSKEIHDCFNSCLSFFDSHLHPKNSNSWLETIDLLNRIDKIPFDLIIEIVKKTRQDDFWAKNFLSLTKLRKNNPDGVKYIVVFNEKIKNNGTSKTNGSNGATDDEIARIWAKALTSE